MIGFSAADINCNYVEFQMIYDSIPRNTWWKLPNYCNDVIMSAMASQITPFTIVYLTVHSRRRSKKTSKLRVTGFYEGNSPVTGEFPAQSPLTRKSFRLMTSSHCAPFTRSSVLIYMFIYMYVHSLYEFCYRSYIQWECHSVLAKLHPITFYRGVRGSWAECHFLFSLVYQLCLALW